ncbi:hypothetical protein GGF46_001702, partial [Coemansia sp. RSA 552]
AERDKVMNERLDKRDKDQAERDKVMNERLDKRDRDQAERDRQIMGALNALVAANRQPEQQQQQQQAQHAATPQNVRRQGASATIASLTTPRNHERHVTTVDGSYYADLGRAMSDKFTDALSIGMVWSRAGIPGKDDWASWLEPNRTFKDRAINRILATYRQNYKALKKAFDPTKEKPCQDAINKLFDAVETHRRTVLGDHTTVFWRNTHNTVITGGIENGRKPDGIFCSKSPNRSIHWCDVEGVVELKHVNCSFDNSHLRGQLVRNLIDMAAEQPRRYSVGLTMAEGCMIYMYICTPGRIYYVEAGEFPHPSQNKRQPVKDRQMVRVILAIYKILSDDPGLLVPKPDEIRSKFSPAAIPGLTPDDEDRALVEISLDNRSMVGRHRRLFGSRSWANSAQCSVDGGELVPCYFKFNWSGVENMEASIHRKVFGMGQMNVPQVLYSATVSAPGGNGVRGELLIIGDAGETFDNRFDALVDHPQVFVDVIAGYVCTLLRAAAGDGNCFILHRDISVGNLLVDKGNRPWIIDWGLGLLECSTGNRFASTEPQLGTAVFMSIRVLAARRRRSVIDDLESLFLVISYCAWEKYGRDRDQQGALWDGKAETSAIMSTRIAWLTSERAYLWQMGLQGCPGFLMKLLKQLYSLLFSEAGIDPIRLDSSDPRLPIFNPHDWVHALEGALDPSQVEEGEMPHLEYLRSHAATSLDTHNRSVTDSAPDSFDETTNSAAQTRSSAKPASRGGAKRGAAETPTQASKRRTVGNRLGKRSETGLTDDMYALDTEDALYDGPSDDNNVPPSLSELLDDSPMTRPVARPSRDRIRTRAQSRFLGERPSGSS